MASLALTTNIAEVRGVAARHVEPFRRLGIRCVADLILHMPLRYEHELEEQTIAAGGEAVGPLHGAEANIAARGEVGAMRTARGKRSRIEATLFDGTATMRVVWFNAPWMRKSLHPGMHIRVMGKAKRFGDYLEMVNPKWEVVEAGGDSASAAVDGRPERFRPVYPGSEELPSKVIEGVIDGVLDETLTLLEDHLPPEYRRKKEMPTLADAYRMVHRPETEHDAENGRRRLAFDELLLMQLGVMLKRRHRQATLRAPKLKWTDAIDKHIRQRLPFELTADQSQVVKEIAGDLQREAPMNRLLQGDVGSGKTAVALYAMLMATASKHQAALMAPTEILAEQHYESIRSMLRGSMVGIQLLTGSLNAASRASILDHTETGEIDILIGTHALLTETVRFKSLALAVIDEQHRFGVHQRAELRAKANEPDSSPHVLVMTATPIPRTLSLTVFGDLDISTIRTLPPGRQPISTRLMSQARVDEVYVYVAKRMAEGEQAYIVVPVIDESDSGLKDVNSHLAWLEKGHLRGRRLAAMHGRLDGAERDEVMRRFRAGEVDAIVATTVIEVGVDVPNASIMVIEHAERFGLAQLHQLRGRVGRGSRKSLCVLIGDATTDDAKARLEAMLATTDGFEIAERDLLIRGPGELFGTRQAGAAPFRVAELPRDMELLQMARRDAAEWVKANPKLQGEQDALLRKRLLKAHGRALGIGDVA